MSALCKVRTLAMRLAAPCAFVAALAWGCANPGTPSGGPKDRRPPVMVSSIPQQGAMDFGGKEIVMTFDENVQLKDADQKFVMSPPTAKKPRVEAHGKKVTVSFEEDLMPATTYTLDFADCLRDLNEGNIAQNFTLSFSTGQTTDSMMVSGNVYDAETYSPVEGIYVLLHSNKSDTAFAKVTPMRLAKTDPYGRFAIKNVPADGDYDIYALDDQNNNFRYDQPGEQIAWLGKAVRPGWEMRLVPDSVKTDSTFIQADTLCYYYEHIMRDTLVLTPDSLKLFAFQQKVYDQFIKADERKERHKISLVFNAPMEQRPTVTFPGQDESARTVALRQFSQANDTVTLWMTDTTVWKRDSIVIAVSYPKLDTLNQFFTQTDTLKEWHFQKPAEPEKKQKKRKRKSDKEDKPKVETLKFKLTTNIPHYADAHIYTNTPFGKFEWDSVHLFQKKDTLFVPISFTHVDDTLDLCHKVVKAKWEPGEVYKIVIDSASVSDIYDLQNDKYESQISVTSLDKYGTLYVDVDSVPANALLQLLDSKGMVRRQSYLKPNGKAGFRYIPQGDYMLRVLEDTNRNGKWDSGDYEAKRQPEKMIYYMQKITVRPNWDIHVEFTTRNFSVDSYSRKYAKKATRRR